MIGRVFAVAVVACLASCATVQPAREFEASVRPDLKPRLASIADAHGVARPIAASRDDRGVQSDFFEGIVALHVASDADLQAYLARFGGTVVRDNALPELPPDFGIQLTPEQRKATTYCIRIDPARVDRSTIGANALAAGVRGHVEFSSELALLTFAAMVNARTAGFKAVGLMNNGKGLAGTGSLVGDVLLIKTGDGGDIKDSIKLAVALGADVVSVSWGDSCDVICRMGDRDDATFDDRYKLGNRPIFVSSAGNDSQYVGDPHFVHPCIEDHVICVGALNDPPNDSTMASLSNYGEGVDVFAPLNIPVMSFPPDKDAAGNPTPFGPEQPQVFSGTSASAPFVAGIAAMMKAINPNLNSDDVAAILVATAHPGVAPATHIVDALAAVRAAAQGIPIVNDRFEPNDIDTSATDLGNSSTYLAPNLNIGGGDRDYFRFVVPGASTATILLRYPRGLGDLSILDFSADSTRCAAPVALSGVPFPGGFGRTLQYRMAGGSHVLGLDAASVNAYHLNIGFETTAIAADAYEPDDTPAQAKSLHSILYTPHAGGVPTLGFSPRVRIEATIHSPTDVDYYIVQGAEVTLKEQVLLNAAPALKVYSNESPVTVQVFRLTPARTAGSLVASLAAPGCATDALAVTPESGVDYLVRISGTPGAYVLSNDVAGSGRRLPQLVHDGIYRVLHPGEPVEHSLPYVEETYVLPGDREYDAMRSNDSRVHLKLLDARGALVAEGIPDERGERVDLRETSAGSVYILQVSRRDRHGDAPAVALQWEPAAALRTSANLITTSRPRLQGNSAHRDSVLREDMRLDAAWRSAVASGRVKARFAAVLNGRLMEQGALTAKITFVDAGGKSLGTLVLPRVSSFEHARTAERMRTEVDDDVARDTATFWIDVAFKGRGGRAGRGLVDAFDDELVLVLTEYAR